MLELFAVFFKIGLLTFGGGLAMLPLVQQEVVRRGWLDLGQVADLMAVAEVTPGPFAVNMATFVGWTRHRMPGALAATGGLVLPSFLVMLVIALCFAGFAKNRRVAAAMNGVRPAVLGLIAAAAWALGALFLFPRDAAGAALGAASAATRETAAAWRAPDLATTALVLVLAAVEWRFKPHPVALIALSMLMGVLVSGCFS